MAWLKLLHFKGTNFFILVSDLPHLYTGSMRSVTLQEAALFRKTGHHYPGVLQTLALQFAISNFAHIVDKICIGVEKCDLA